VELRAEVLRLALALAVLVAGVTAIRVVRYDGFTVKGVNMEPAMMVGDDYLVRPDGNAGRGDVVVAEIPGGSNVLSRVIAVGGDVIEFADGQVLLNGAVLTEPYLAPGTRTEGPESGLLKTVVPPTTVYLMGDNRGSSQDSRIYGPVSADGVVGSVVDAWWWLPAD
jgi:signal peptidase I